MNRKHIIAVCALALCTALCIVGVSALTEGRSRPTGGTEPPSGTEKDEPECSLGPAPEPGAPLLTPGNILPFDMRSVGFSAQYLRTDGYHEGMTYPRVKIIRSVEELNAYYEANRDRYHMCGFPEACERYDETYFKDRVLVIVVVESGSGSIRYQVTDAAMTGVNKDVLAIAIDVLDPGMGTCDMAEWHILIEPAEGVDVTDERYVSVNLHTGSMGKLPGNNTDTVYEPITEEQAVEIAKAVVTVEYDYVKAVYDTETAAWTVDFARENTLGGDQTVTLDPYGIILGSTYGE